MGQMIKIKKIDEIDLKQKYNETQDDRLTKDVANIIADVRENGDKALRDYTARFDGVAIDTFKVSDREIDEAIHSVKKASCPYWSVLRIISVSFMKNK